tara:strand:- start:47 stop:604 length:558 start_codon:yes stop_codon:yes gene_type:complete
MNYFILDEDIRKAAQYHLDKHIVKMPTETMQLLGTAHRMIDGNVYVTWNKRGARMTKYYLNDGRQDIISKCGHHKHPCQVWLQESADNYDWLFEFMLELCKEYTYRYGKTHMVEKKSYLYKDAPKNLPRIGLTPFKIAIQHQDIKDKFAIHKNVVKAYREYYILYKKHIAKWTKRQIPNWFIPQT